MKAGEGSPAVKAGTEKEAVASLMEWVKGVQWLLSVYRNWVCMPEKCNQCASRKIRGPASRKETQNRN